ncbi:hypothetical protein [Cystobacter fuscus]|uniref:hypothetical protein n=1 Tax=Cystobacter fuscus TaxID=43 RepID=UPI0012FDBD5A|nr:hypothetical protein [Cystobacter fuscus]
MTIIIIGKKDIAPSPLLCLNGRVKIISECPRPLKSLTIKGPEKDTVRTLSPKVDVVIGPEQGSRQVFQIAGFIGGRYTINAEGCEDPKQDPKQDAKTGTLEVSTDPRPLPGTK